MPGCVTSTFGLRNMFSWGFELENSKWFTRGWTLQELLAPRMVVFFDKFWVDIGSKNSLQTVLSNITGIGEHELENFRKACVARKMLWASKRVTTRLEDRAYSLMGLFGVSMPTLYGEGNQAFYRLQLKILSKSDDESIFACSTQSLKGVSTKQDRFEITAGNRQEVKHGVFDVAESQEILQAGLARQVGMMATSPLDFAMCGDVKLSPIHGVPYMERSLYAMTNKGLRIEHMLHRCQELMHQTIVFCLCFIAKWRARLETLQSPSFKVGLQNRLCEYWTKAFITNCQAQMGFRKD
jgi:hypothetical protein